MDNNQSINASFPLHGVQPLRATSQTNDAEADRLRAASQDFEAIFLSYLLKVMRSTVESAEAGSALGKDIYLEMFDTEIAHHIAKTRSLGVADMLYKQLNDVETPVSPLMPQVDASPLPLSLASPVSGRLSSDYGARADPLTGRAKFHRGIDIAAAEGTPFRTASAGTVVFAGVLGEYGNTIIVEHQDRKRTLYAHAARVLVSAGDDVKSEQVIGLVGSTGRSTGAHLHFEAQIDGQAVDPVVLLGASNFKDRLF